jgi:hypothetical protein
MGLRPFFSGRPNSYAVSYDLLFVVEVEEEVVERFR